MKPASLAAAIALAYGATRPRPIAPLQLLADLGLLKPRNSLPHLTIDAAPGAVYLTIDAATGAVLGVQV